MPKVLCVANPKSRNGTVGQRIPSIEESVRNHEAECTTLDLTETGFESNLIAALAEGVDVVLAAGGDGTQHSVINTLKQLKKQGAIRSIPPFAVCPFGTGNDIAKSLGLIPGRGIINQAVGVALKGETINVDLGFFDGVHFADMISLGMDAAILSRRDALADSLRRRPLLNRIIHGYVVYLMAGFKKLCERPTWPGKIRLDGKDWWEGRFSNLLINNCPIHAGEFEFTPGAKMDDGLLDIVVIPGVLGYVGGFIRSWRHWPGSLRSSKSPRLAKAKSIRIELDAPAPAQVDGELTEPIQSVEISVEPSAIEMRIPG